MIKHWFLLVTCSSSHVKEKITGRSAHLLVGTSRERHRRHTSQFTPPDSSQEGNQESILEKVHLRQILENRIKFCQVGRQKKKSILWREQNMTYLVIDNPLAMCD